MRDVEADITYRFDLAGRGTVGEAQMIQRDKGATLVRHSGRFSFDHCGTGKHPSVYTLLAGLVFNGWQ